MRSPRRWGAGWHWSVNSTLGGLGSMRRRSSSSPTFPSRVAAEISPVQNISYARALGQVRVAKALRERLPRVAEMFRRGWIDYRVVATIMSRTQNVEPDIMAELDEALAAKAEKWMKLSGPKLVDRVDMFVARFDPEAVRIPSVVENNRHIDIDPGAPGMAWLSGNLRATDGAALDDRLNALAATVCDNDPRTKEQRRADACGPLARREATLPCECGLDDCPATAERAGAATAVIDALAELGTLDGASDKPGYLKGFGVLPAESVRKLAKNATVKPVTLPGTDAKAEAGYRPSVALRDFLQWRDLTCRWPGCDKPVERCDVDHTTPWPHGKTHPSNKKALLPYSPFDQDFLLWSRWLERSTITRRHNRVDRSDRAPMANRTSWRKHVPGARAVDGCARDPGRYRIRQQRRPVCADAPPQTEPGGRPPRPDQGGTSPARRADRRRRAPTPSLARRQLRTAALLKPSDSNKPDRTPANAEARNQIG